MSQPLGTHVGNSLEVEESLALLRGEGPDDLKRLCLRLTAHMLVLGGIAPSIEEGERRAERELHSGRGHEKFLDMVRAQGGDPRVADGNVLPRARQKRAVPAPRSGYVSSIDTEILGTAAMVLGAGREKVEDVIDPAAGLIVEKKLGHRVEKGEPLVILHYNDSSRLSVAEERVRSAYLLSETSPAGTKELILAVLEQ
jgi:thymidine phosphorylase